MMKRKRSAVKMVGWILLIPVVLFLLFVLFLSLTDYRPKLQESIEIRGKGMILPPQKTEFTFLTWNIGYGGLGKRMDFFYEGGTRVKPEQKEFAGYLSGITRVISSNDSVDFIFIQEADTHSKRSYYTDEVAEIGKVLPERAILFAKNYDCRFVPVPLDDPMGRVVSGIACYPKFRPVTAVRIDLGTRFSWPKQLVMLKRCLLLMRYRLEGGKELMIITLHNSTFDKGGELRKEELAEIQKLMLSEFRKGNYVIAGGDWNNNPRGYRQKSIKSGDLTKEVDPVLDESFLPGWRFAFDSLAPSNRDVDMPYQKGKTKTTIIDFYVVSPNVEVTSVHTVATGFNYSDHQPVIMKAVLK